MAIIVNLDVVLAQKKMSVTELSEKVGITMANIVVGSAFSIILYSFHQTDSSLSSLNNHVVLQAILFHTLKCLKLQLMAHCVNSYSILF